MRRLSLRAARLDHAVERSHRARHAGARRQRIRGAHGVRPDRGRARVRVLGARGRAHPGRGLPALQAPHGRAADAPLVRRRDRRRLRSSPSACCAEIRKRGRSARAPSRARAAAACGTDKPAKRMLEALWTHRPARGRRARGNFERLYDLPERVLPREAARRAGAGRGDLPPLARGSRRPRPRLPHRLGASSSTGASPAATKRDPPHLDALVEEGELERARGRRRRPRRSTSSPAPSPAGSTAAVLLSPFDNLIWDRAFTERLLRLPPHDRGLQAGPSAAVRLLRAPVPARATAWSAAPT